MRPAILYLFSAALSSFTAAQLALSPDTLPLSTLIFAQPDSENLLTAQVPSEAPTPTCAARGQEGAATRCIDVSQLNLNQSANADPLSNAVHPTGIEGFVAIAPIEPIARLGIFKPRPYAATITILNAAGQIVSEARTDSNGYFRFNLQPGVYTLSPEVVTAHAETQVVTVSDTGFTTVEVIYQNRL